MKHNGRHKTRLVDRSNLTNAPIDSVYSRVILLRDFQIYLFLTKLNVMEAYTADIGKYTAQVKRVKTRSARNAEHNN